MYVWTGAKGTGVYGRTGGGSKYKVFERGVTRGASRGMKLCWGLSKRPVL